MNEQRFEKGLARLQQMNDNSKIGPLLEEISPDLNVFIKEFAFGDVHSREGLSARDREMIILASLCTLGHAPLELKSHINMGLNAGLSKEEILEIFIQMAVYAGFPAAVNATFTAKEVFEEREK